MQLLQLQSFCYILFATPGVSNHCSKVPTTAHFTTQRGTETSCLQRKPLSISPDSWAAVNPHGERWPKLAPQRPLQPQENHRTCPARPGATSAPASCAWNWIKFCPDSLFPLGVLTVSDLKAVLMGEGRRNSCREIGAAQAVRDPNSQGGRWLLSTLWSLGAGSASGCFTAAKKQSRQAGMGHMLIPSPARESAGVPPHKEGELDCPSYPCQVKRKRKSPGFLGFLRLCDPERYTCI